MSGQVKPAAALAAAPRLVRCECGADVVVAPTCRGGVLILDAGECLATMPCPSCRRTWTAQPWCVRCRGTGSIGGVLPRVGHALLGADGLARRGQPGRTDRLRGEALHRVHRCAAGALEVAA